MLMPFCRFCHALAHIVLFLPKTNMFYFSLKTHIMDNNSIFMEKNKFSWHPSYKDTQFQKRGLRGDVIVCLC